MEAGDRGTGSRRIETCKLNAVDPPAYLVDILTRLVNLWAAFHYVWGARSLRQDLESTERIAAAR